MKSMFPSGDSGTRVTEIIDKQKQLQLSKIQLRLVYDFYFQIAFHELQPFSTANTERFPFNFLRIYYVSSKYPDTWISRELSFVFKFGARSMIFIVSTVLFHDSWERSLFIWEREIKSICTNLIRFCLSICYRIMGKLLEQLRWNLEPIYRVVAVQACGDTPVTRWTITFLAMLPQRKRIRPKLLQIKFRNFSYSIEIFHSNEIFLAFNILREWTVFVVTL